LEGLNGVRHIGGELSLLENGALKGTGGLEALRSVGAPPAARRRAPPPSQPTIDPSRIPAFPLSPNHRHRLLPAAAPR